MVSPYIGGIGQGIGTGLQNLTQILLERQARQREEESAQGLLQMLALVLGDQGGPGGAPGGQGGGILPEVSTPQAPILSGISPAPGGTGTAGKGGGYNAFLTALSSGKFKPKTRQESLAAISLLQGLRAEERDTAKEERELQRALALEGERGRQQRLTKGAERGFEEADIQEESIGEASALLGIPPDQAAAQAKALGLSPRGVKGYVAGLTETKRAKAREKEVGLTPEEILSNEETMRVLSTLSGRPIPESQIKIIARGKEGARQTMELIGSPTWQMADEKARQKHIDTMVKIELALAKIEGSADPAAKDAAQAYRTFLSAAMNQKQASGKPLWTPQDATTLSDTFLTGYKQKYPGSDPRIKAASRLNALLKTVEAPREAAPTIPIPQVLAEKGMPEEVWNEGVAAYVKAGRSVLDYLQDLYKDGTLNDQDMAALAAELGPQNRR